MWKIWLIWLLLFCVIDSIRNRHLHAPSQMIKKLRFLMELPYNLYFKTCAIIWLESLLWLVREQLVGSHCDLIDHCVMLVPNWKSNILIHIPIAEFCQRKFIKWYIEITTFVLFDILRWYYVYKAVFRNLLSNQEFYSLSSSANSNKSSTPIIDV